MALGQVCPTCKQTKVIRRGTTSTGVQRYQCRNTACAHPYFRARYYKPPFRTYAAYVAHWRRQKQQNRKVYHRSLTTEWGTPQAFFDQLHAEFGFTLDVAAQPGNAKCSHYFTEAEDGLRQVWEGVCWCNPPYGKTIGLWVAKAYASAQAGATVVCLLPVRNGYAMVAALCAAGSRGALCGGAADVRRGRQPGAFPQCGGDI